MKEDHLQMLEEKYQGYGLKFVEKDVMELIEEVRRLKQLTTVGELVEWDEKMNDLDGNPLYLLMNKELLYYYGQERGELIFGHRIKGAAEFSEDSANKFVELFQKMGEKTFLIKKETRYREVEHIEKERIGRNVVKGERK